MRRAGSRRRWRLLRRGALCKWLGGVASAATSAAAALRLGRASIGSIVQTFALGARRPPGLRQPDGSRDAEPHVIQDHSTEGSLRASVPVPDCHSLLIARERECEAARLWAWRFCDRGASNFLDDLIVLNAFIEVDECSHGIGLDHRL